MSKLLGAGHAPGSETEAIFQKLHNYLGNEREQVERLPEEIRREIETNSACDIVPGASGDFGKAHSSPIPVNGPLGEALYLSSLRVSGKPVFFHRLGSYEKVDIFEIVSADSTVWDVLCMSCYFPRRSKYAPKGYVLDKSVPTRFYGTTVRVQPFPSALYMAIRSFTVRQLGIPLPNREVREALSTLNYVPPEVHRRLIGELTKSPMTLALTDSDMDST